MVVIHILIGCTYDTVELSYLSLFNYGYKQDSRFKRSYLQFIF